MIKNIDNPPRIQKLSSHITDQIAAGEVVERPSSVIKELIENSIDAQADRIEVEIQEGGKKLIRVVDNGWGIYKEDLPSALDSHATSKISSIEDLLMLQTLGFRGEALPSIASVSKLTLSSRIKNQPDGYIINAEGGKISAVEAIGISEGTIVEVNELFYNVPARLKFLKSDKTELNSIKDTITKLAVPHFNIHFVLKENNKIKIKLLAQESVENRISEIFPDNCFINGKADYEDINIELWLSRPEKCISSAGDLYFYINSRIIKDKIIYKAIMNSYANLLTKGTYPYGVVIINLPSQNVDVNVHPQKSEVRFSNPKPIFYCLNQALYQAFYQLQLPGTLADSTGYKEVELSSVQSRVLEAVARYEQKHSTPSNYNSYKDHKDQNLYKGQFSVKSAPIQSDIFFQNDKNIENTVNENITSDLSTPSQWKYAKLQYIGQLADTYLLFSDEKDLVIIDEHAAHERVTYGKLKKELTNNKIPAQVLIAPIRLKLNYSQKEILENYKSELSKFGIDIEEFGADDILITSLPVYLSANPKEIQHTIIELADKLSIEGFHDKISNTHNTIPLSSDLIDIIIATIACHSSIRKGKKVTGEEARYLVEQLDETQQAGYCPHGRPVAWKITDQEIEKKFKRS